MLTMIVMTQRARTAGFGISASDSVMLWSTSSGLQAAHCGQSDSNSALICARHHRARMWRWYKQVYQSLLKDTVEERGMGGNTTQLCFCLK